METLLKEYRDLKLEDPRSNRVTIKEAISPKFKKPVYLESISEGWTSAGSVARWQEAGFAVSEYVDGSRHGKGFLKLEDAEACFLKRTTPDTVLIKQNGKICELWVRERLECSGGRIAMKKAAEAYRRYDGARIFNVKANGAIVEVTTTEKI